MGTFRPGKPWLQLFLTPPSTQSSGLHFVNWAEAQSDGDWSSTVLPTSSIPVDVPGLYLLHASVARDSPATSSNVVGRLVFDGQVIARARGPADATAYGVSLSQMVMVTTPGSVVRVEAQLHASATVGFDEDATLLSLVRIGPVRWT